MPQRFLKPGITSSPKWNACGWMAQSFYIRLITLVDDYGRFEACPRLLRSLAFPLSEDLRTEQVLALMRELESQQLVHFYKAGEKEYFQLTGWSERARAEKSRFPEMNGGCKQMFADAVKCCPPSPSSSPSSSPAGAALHPPSFEPVRKGLFRREYADAIKDCDAEIKAIRTTEGNWQHELSKPAREIVAFLTKEKRDGWEVKVREIQEKPESHAKTKLTVQAQAAVSAWEHRKAEIKRAMNGVK